MSPGHHQYAMDARTVCGSGTCRSGYLPTPVDTSHIVLRTELEDLAELLAENTHEHWYFGPGVLLEDPFPSNIGMAKTIAGACLHVILDVVVLTPIPDVSCHVKYSTSLWLWRSGLANRPLPHTPFGTTLDRMFGAISFCSHCESHLRPIVR
jgi:hypothetical protein